MTPVGHTPEERHERLRAIGDPQRRHGRAGPRRRAGRRAVRVFVQPDRRRAGRRERRRSCSRFCSPTRRRERPALYFTVLGEPTIKMLRYQRSSISSMRRAFRRRCASSTWRRRRRAETSTRFCVASLGPKWPRCGRRSSPSIRFGRSSASSNRRRRAASIELARFVNRLAQQLTTWEVTSFLIGEYADDRATPSGLHGGRHDSLVVRGRRSKFGDAQAARGQGSRTKPDAWAAHVSAHRRGHAGLSAHPGATAATRRSRGTCVSRPEFRGSTR